MIDWHEPLPLATKARLTVEILGSYLVARRAMRTSRLITAVEQVRDIATPRPVPAADHEAASRHLASAVNRVVGRLPTDSRCLARALTLSRCLARREIPALLVLGARVEPEFGAHAWVESGGSALLPPGDETMKRLVSV